MSYVIMTIELLVAVGAVVFVAAAAKKYRAMKKEKRAILAQKWKDEMMRQLHEVNDPRFEQGLEPIQPELPKIKATAFDPDEYESSLTLGQWIRYKEMQRRREREETR